MAVTPKKLYLGQPGTSAAALYTAPTSTKAIVKNIIICNTSANAATITLHFVASGGSATAANQVVDTLTIEAGDTIIMDLSAVLETGEKIMGLQGTASAITLHISGVEVS